MSNTVAYVVAEMVESGDDHLYRFIDRSARFAELRLAEEAAERLREQEPGKLYVVVQVSGV